MSASEDRGAGEGDVDPDRRLRAVEREQREPGNDRRQSERQVDDRVDHRLAAKVVPHENPGGDRPEHGIEDGDDERCADRQLERCDGLWARDRSPRTPRLPSLREAQTSAAIGSITISVR